MERLIYKQLKEWKDSADRKPLILNGARQVGKTYLLRELGAREYAKVAYFSLDRDLKARQVFDSGVGTATMLLSLSAISGIDITPDDTLVILDEIQECPKALEALKFFQEELSEIHIVVAGSLLGISLHGSYSFPVGKVDMLRLYPLNFKEFLMAMGKSRLAEIDSDEAVQALSVEYTELLRYFYYVGGMPAVVSSFIESRSLIRVREIQRQILFDYQRDFSKHAPKNEVPRINMVWNSIPSQLARENKKFIFGALRKGARAVDFELALEWLVDAGLVYKVNRVRAAQMPLKFYEDSNAFKLFMLDIGLMGAMADTPAEQVIVGDNIFKEYKGAFTELYVLTEMCAAGITAFYHTPDNSVIEIDFLIQKGNEVIPIEVKSEQNLRSKSMRTFILNHSDLKGVRLSMSGKCDQEWMINLPLYHFVDEMCLKTTTIERKG